MVIYKYQLKLTEKQKIEISGGVRIISAIEQRDQIVVYAIVNPDKQALRTFEIFIFGTGNKFEYQIGMEFIGTVSMFNGDFVWHVFSREVKMYGV